MLSQHVLLVPFGLRRCRRCADGQTRLAIQSSGLRVLLLLVDHRLESIKVFVLNTVGKTSCDDFSGFLVRACGHRLRFVRCEPFAFLVSRDFLTELAVLFQAVCFCTFRFGLLFAKLFAVIRRFCVRLGDQLAEEIANLTQAAYEERKSK